MLDVTVRLNPYGRVEDGRPLARIRIANVSFEMEREYHHCYVYRIQEPKSQFGKEIDYWGMIINYDRNKPVINLLAEVMEGWSHNCHRKPIDYLDDEYVKKIKELWNDSL